MGLFDRTTVNYPIAVGAKSEEGVKKCGRGDRSSGFGAVQKFILDAIAPIVNCNIME
jgi:hypothetical protein